MESTIVKKSYFNLAGVVFHSV